MSIGGVMGNAGAGVTCGDGSWVSRVLGILATAALVPHLLPSPVFSRELLAVNAD